MILATRFTFIVEKKWKSMYFHSKLAWPPPTYGVISRNHRNWPSLNLTQNASERWMNSYLLPRFYFFALPFTLHRSPLSERLEQASGQFPKNLKWSFLTWFHSFARLTVSGQLKNKSNRNIPWCHQERKRKAARHQMWIKHQRANLSLLCMILTHHHHALHLNLRLARGLVNRHMLQKTGSSRCHLSMKKKSQMLN